MLSIILCKIDPINNKLHKKLRNIWIRSFLVDGMSLLAEILELMLLMNKVAFLEPLKILFNSLYIDVPTDSTDIIFVINTKIKLFDILMSDFEIFK